MAEPITNILGVVGMKHCGIYDDTTYYEKLNVVTYEGSSYCAKKDTVGNLPTNTTYWDLLAERGSQGIQGIQGVQGEPGYTPVKGVDYYTASDVTELESSLSNDVHNEVVNQLDGLVSATPIAVNSVSAMTDTSRIYVNTTDGYWYYYNGNSWVQGDVYQASVDNDNVDYLINRDNSSNYVNYDMLTNIYELSEYKNITQKNLVQLYNSIGNGLTVTHNGLNKFNIKGTALASGINKLSRKITLKANTTYTFAGTDYTYNTTDSNIYIYLYEYGTSNSYKDSTNTTIKIQLNSGNKNVAVSFTNGNTDKEVEIGTYAGASTARDNNARLYIIEGNYSISDIKGSTMLKETLNNRKFVGTASASTVIPTFNTPVFYLAQGPGPFTNFGSSTKYTASDYFLIYNSMAHLDQWNINILPFMLKNSLNRQSVRPVSPSTNISLNPGERYWVIACEEGTYTNFIGYNGSPLTLSKGEVAIFNTNWDVTHDPAAWWSKDTITNLKSKDYIDSAIDTALGGIGDNIETFIYEWLNDHPEATTTVEDGSISINKLDTNLQNKANRIRLDSNSSTNWQSNNNDLNTIVGANNMPNGIGSRNTIVGIDNLQANNSTHSANYEIAVGYHALFRDWDGDHNVSVGNESMDNVSHGSYNTAIGSNSLRSQRLANYGGTGVEGETANYNTSVGGSAMYYTYGNNNTAIGHEALRGNTYGATGSNNIAIGKCAGKYNSNESNKLYIDDRDRGSRQNEIAKSLIYGNFADDIVDQFIKINGMFACNGKTPQSPLTAVADATDLASAITLLNQIKDALIKCGIMK